MEEYDFREIRGHIQVYLDGKFLFSADTMREAIEEIELESGNIWGHSSAGRAPALQAGSRRFKSDCLHQFPKGV